MRRFDSISAPAAALPLDNIDTDKILPARFLKTIKREGLGGALFHTMRFDEEGRERAEFTLNREPWRRSGILIARNNFGCGSSREHAPWALVDFGIRCIIAVSFADIFYNNCFKNGILPIFLDPAVVEALMTQAEDQATATLTVELGPQRIKSATLQPIEFEIPFERKRALLLGLDDIAETLGLAPAIDAFENQYAPPYPGVPMDVGAKSYAPTRSVEK